MGNSSSSSSRTHDESVDFGYLTPQGVYTGPRDWNQSVVTQLICARRLAPFYRPLEDYEDSWSDDQILAARKDLPQLEGAGETSPRPEQQPLSASSTSSSSKSSHSKRPNTLKEPSKPEAAVYRGATECPICFLYYPPNINFSRCCDQAICTECFVQIKRSEPTTTHLVSEPAACPYCVQENFGVVYTPPPWRAGIGSEGSPSPRSDSPKYSQQSLENPPRTHKRRQKSFSADSPEVVTTDQIRPDWEAKLAAVRAAVTRRANRRIIMRRVGDQLIPVGVTSGRVHALSPEEAANATAAGGDNGIGSWRSRRRPQAGNGYEQYLGQDLEELMLMEAMRLSLIEHEAQQKREAEEKKKAEAKAANAGNAQEGSASSAPELDSSDSSSTQKVDSLRVKRGSIFSRSRSPSPGKQSAGPSSSAFSTVAAALTSSTSTASAILRSSNQTSDTSPEPSTPVQSTSQPQRAPHPPSVESASASVTTVSSSSSSNHSPPTPPSITIAPPHPPTSSSPESARATSTVLSPTSPSSEISDIFETLPSSPEEMSAAPLIPKDVKSGNSEVDGQSSGGTKSNSEDSQSLSEPSHSQLHADVQ